MGQVKLELQYIMYGTFFANIAVTFAVLFGAGREQEENRKCLQAKKSMTSRFYCWKTAPHQPIVTPRWGVSCLRVFVSWTSCFILKSNSPLISGHLLFLVCHRSDVSPDYWSFPPVSLYPDISYSLRLPLSHCQSISFIRVPPAFVHSPHHSTKPSVLAFVYFWFLSSSEEEWLPVVIFWPALFEASFVL